MRYPKVEPRALAVLKAAVKWHARKLSDDELLIAVDRFVHPELHLHARRSFPTPLQERIMRECENDTGESGE